MLATAATAATSPTARFPNTTEKCMNLTCFMIHTMRKKRSRRSMLITLTLLSLMMLQEQSPRREHIQVPYSRGGNTDVQDDRRK